ncbi:MAG: phosphate acyltransferase PlsX [Deltaproteobacteria bacterium]|nr:MAG: phosphate acyltransferase PlsX [Deltaproteobacteria bacterium]
MKFRIGLDISGGDLAPAEPLKGAYLAKKEINSDLVLIGTKEDLEFREKLGLDFNKERLVEVEEKIGMEEPPAASIRRKKNSSIVVGIKLIKKGKINAFVSCGNTGAVVCAATLNLGLIKGIERPGIAIFLPTLKNNISILIDAGANIDPKPTHLFQYGIMASLYYSLVLGEKNPTVGLLNIGEESSKGPDFVKKTFSLFSSSSLNFIGNLEAKDIFLGRCDCIICDGFVGNVALKISEGFAEAVGKFLLDSIKSDFLGRMSLFFVRRSLKRFKKITDYAEYGGAPLLGVDGTIIIGHGRSSAYAVKNAIKVAEKELMRHLNEEIKRRLDEFSKNNRIGKMFT